MKMCFPRGWGLRSVDDIPAGAFVCTYGGQILNEDMADKVLETKLKHSWHKSLH